MDHVWATTPTYGECVYAGQTDRSVPSGSPYHLRNGLLTCTEGHLRTRGSADVYVMMLDGDRGMLGQNLVLKSHRTAFQSINDEHPPVQAADGRRRSGPG
ncbi:MULTISPECIES: hypothetical protein [Streptomyces]|uniref:hypothetical protein n=1 Tax=Streptomyces TaxID=1883 RepID=UPI00131D2836|nr:hypothetical protein [Streptomyces sp. AS58]